jgi:hypothetical protein
VRFLFDGQRINPTQTPQEVSRARVPSKTKTMHPMGGAHISVRAPHPSNDNPDARPRLSSTQQLDMEDGDSIDAMMEQVGGC